MSPEQAEGKSRALDHHTDIYSLGVTLYELLTLKPAFGDNDRHKLIHQIIDGDPRPPRQLNPSIPRDVETIVLKAISAEPEARYGTAQELADDLKRFLEYEPIRARRPSPVERMSKWSRRHLPVVWSAVVVLTLSTIGLAVSPLLISREHTKATAAYEGQRTATELANEQTLIANKQKRWAIRQEELAIQQRNLAKRNVYLADMQLAAQAWEAADISRLEELLEAHRPKPGEDDLRGWEWYYLQALCHRDQLTLRAHENWIEALAFSPDGKWLASAARYGEVKVWDLSTGKVILRQVAMDYGQILVWSPDAKRLAWIGRARGRVWEVGTGREVITLGRQDHREFGTSVAFSPDGKRVAFATSTSKDEGVVRWDGTIRMYDMATGEEELSIRTPESYVFSVAWRPDSARLAAASVVLAPTAGAGRPEFVDRITLFDPTSGQQLAAFDTGLEGPRSQRRGYSLAWSPDGERIGLTSDGHVKVWKPDTGEEVLHIDRGLRRDLRFLVFGPDGERLVWIDEISTTVSVWDTTTNREVLSVGSHYPYYVSRRRQRSA